MTLTHFQCVIGWNHVRYPRITITNALTFAGSTGGCLNRRLLDQVFKHTRALVSGQQKIIFLFLKQNICCGYSKEPLQPKHVKNDG